MKIHLSRRLFALVTAVGCTLLLAACGSDEDATANTGPDQQSCEEICTLGDMECTENSVRLCMTIDGCPDWSSPSECDEGASCEEGRCVEACDAACSVGDARCGEEGLEYCVDIAGCPDWTDAGECNDDESCVDGQCIDECDAPCTPGQRECSGDDYRVCEEGADGCAQWSAPRSCENAGEVCSGGQCTQDCTDQCATGDAQCSSGDDYQICEEQSSGCLDWSTPEDCPGDMNCEQGQCVDTCTDQCSDGDIQCDGIDGFQICQQHSNGCFDWSPSVDCPDGLDCSGGQCVDTCTDQCSDGDAQCDGVDGFQVCQQQSSGCYDWSPSIDCPGGLQCSGGECVDECTDQCSGGDTECSGTSGLRHCQEQTNGCYDWSPAVDCPNGLTCSAGECIDDCTDHCSDGDAQCDGTSDFQVCQEQVNGCYDWSSSVACPADHECSDGQCVIICTDQCTEDGVQCDGGDGFQVCEEQADGCYDWSSTVACSDELECSGGECVDECTDQCTEGDTQCSGDSGVRTCEEQSTGCLDWSPAVQCSDGLECSDGECVDACTDQCSDGDAQCSSDAGVQICQEQSNGCYDWSPSIDCPDGLECSGGECVDDCTDQCVDGDAQCSGDSGVQLCHEQTNGCYDWSPSFSCSDGQTCENGQCVDECPDGCSTDIDGAVAYCDGGQCVEECAFEAHDLCPAYDTCADLDNDDEHCGSCGSSCSDGEQCIDENCVADCPSGQTYCEEVDGCVDLTSDDDHCGSCGNACPDSQSCSNSSCEQGPLDGCDPGASPFGGGEGNAVEPYRICSAVQLIRIDDSEEYLGDHYELYDHIELDGVGFSVIGQAQGAIGDWDGGFTGVFDGNGFQIRDLEIDTPNDDYVGLFGVIDDGDLRNVELVNATISGEENVGALVGLNEGTVLNSTSSGTALISGQERVGGLVGHNTTDGTVDGSTSAGEVQGAEQSIGGLVGYSRGRILNSESSANAQGNRAVGGLVGEIDSSSTCLIERSKASGNIGQADEDAINGFGGLLGMAWGYNVCEIKESVATGDVTVPNGSRMAGFIGYIYAMELLIRDSYATGDVNGGFSAGGFLGHVANDNTWDAAEIDDSYYFGANSSENRAFASFPSETNIRDCRWNSDTNEDDENSPATGLTEAEFGDVSNFSDWDFTDVWTMSDDLGRPILQWELD